VRQPRLIADSDEEPKTVTGAPPQPTETGGHVPVWDVAIRLFHWGLVAAVLVSWFTGGTGNRIHEISGSAVAGLLLFRLGWGVVGTRHARFIDFVRSPKTLIAYLRDVMFNRAERHVGHNPAGGAMIIALLLCLTVIVGTGFMQLTNRFYGLEWVEKVHHYAANGLMLLIPLHLVGVIISSWMHQENLVGAMLSGEKPVRTSQHPEAVAVPSDSERFIFRLQGSQGFSTVLFLLAGGLAVGWVITSGRQDGGAAAVAEVQAPQPAPTTMAPAIQEQAVARNRDRQDYASSSPDDASLAWQISSGGRLYDNIFASLGAKGPTTTHPSWPQSNTTLQGEATWRCKNCHGWDYQGRDGQYRTGPNATGIAGVQRARGRDPAVIIATLGNATHQYADEVLPQHAKYRLAVFISRGLHDASRTIQPNGVIKGDVGQGKAVFQTVCASCHGFDGRARKLGASADSGFTGSPLYVGTKAATGPHEVLHKIRNGHPGAIMASMRAFPMDVAANLLAYAQTLPVK
jgi:cytochrome b/mono/diheme cytochrome c family protein